VRSGAIIFVEIPVRDLGTSRRVRVDRWVAFESNRIGANQVLAVKPDERGHSGMPRTRVALLT
jgi:hypothetical protein